MNIIRLVLLVVLLGSCGERDREFVEYDKNGILVSRAKGKDLGNACYEALYSNGNIKHRVCFVDSLKQGLMLSYYEGGALYRSVFYVNDTIVGQDTVFYPTGEINKVIDIQNNLANGYIYIYNKDGTLKAFNEVEDDSVFYIKTYSYRDGVVIDSQEAYNAIIKTNRDTFMLEDTVAVTFRLPKVDSARYDINKFFISYDYALHPTDDTKHDGVSHKAYLLNGVHRDSFIVIEPGRMLIGGYLDYEDTRVNAQQHGWCEKLIYVIEK